MKFREYVKDKAFSIFMYIIFGIIMTGLSYLFNLNTLLVIYICIFYVICGITALMHDFLKRKKFYNQLEKKYNDLDNKALINELIESPDFTEGKILYDYLYDENKSYMEKLKEYKISNEEFKEYIELWCHEIKTPIATEKLIVDNNRNETTESILEETEKIENFVEQILFYARSGNVEKDYIISEVNLKDIIQKVIRKNKKDFINKHIRIETFEQDVLVKSDVKWIEYVINQIVTNSIKYSKNQDAKISIDFKENKNNIMLYIDDNGIGIKNEEVKNVFNKGFTGSNGRKEYNSTGMGLYLCKKLCDKLGHSISIVSKENEYTKVTIVFPKSSMII